MEDAVVEVAVVAVVAVVSGRCGEVAVAAAAGDVSLGLQKRQTGMALWGLPQGHRTAYSVQRASRSVDGQRQSEGRDTEALRVAAEKMTKITQKLSGRRPEYYAI